MRNRDTDGRKPVQSIDTGGAGYKRTRSRSERNGKNLLAVEGSRSSSVAAVTGAAGSAIHPEDDFDLVEPRTVLRQVHEADPVVAIRQELLAAWPSISGCRSFFSPARSGKPQCSATNVTRLADLCVLRQSTIIIHSALGSVSTVRSMWATNSGSVRVASSVGQTIFPVTTSRPAVSVVVPCRVYSNSCLATPPPAATGLSGAFRSMACNDVASSTLRGCDFIPWPRGQHGASLRA